MNCVLKLFISIFRSKRDTEGSSSDSEMSLSDSEISTSETESSEEEYKNNEKSVGVLGSLSAFQAPQPSLFSFA